jgi:hypothetical protein
MMEEVSRWKQRMGERGLDPLRGPRSTKKTPWVDKGRHANGTGRACCHAHDARSV